MLERIQQSWHAFKESEPGYRFQDRYARRRRDEHGRWGMGALLNIVVGAALALIGLVLVPAPGPGWIITVGGLGLLGGEFRAVARVLDWAEVRLRRGLEWAKRAWDRSSPGVKALLVLLGLLCVATLGYGAYRLLMGG